MPTRQMLFLLTAIALQIQAHAQSGDVACGDTELKHKVVVHKKQKPLAEPDASRAIVYVVRKGSFGLDAQAKVAANGKWVGGTTGRGYFFFYLDPGEHELCSMSARIPNRMRFKVEAGKTYYLEQLDIPGVSRPLSVLREISAESARKILERAQYSTLEELPAQKQGTTK